MPRPSRAAAVAASSKLREDPSHELTLDEKVEFVSREVIEEALQAATPKKGRGKKREAAEPAGEPWEAELEKKKRGGGREKKAGGAALEEVQEVGPQKDGEIVETPAKKPRKKRAPKPEPVYNISPIPEEMKKKTEWKGRLGYACLNTILRKKKPDPIFCSRTCRLATIAEKGIDFAKELGSQNVKDLLELCKWNKANGIKFMRMSSEMFPFASHKVHGYTLAYAEEELKAVGEYAKAHGHRLTIHPGQFTQLGSPKPDVIDASVRDLEYHAEIMRRMGLGPESVMILHMGGVYGDKQAAIERFKENWKTRLSQDVKDRLVLENDEICYNLDDILPVCEELGIPIILDWHHDWINPSSLSPVQLLPRINALWAKRGIKPKQHLSEPRPGAETVMEKRTHSDRCKSLPEGFCSDGVEVDLMIEAKDKEQAVLELYRIYNLHPVIYESLRPPADVETLQTNGRKSRTPRKKKAEEAVDGSAAVEAGIDPGEPDEDDHEPVEEVPEAARPVRKRGKAEDGAEVKVAETPAKKRKGRKATVKGSSVQVEKVKAQRVMLGEESKLSSMSE